MTCVIQKTNEDKILVNFGEHLNGFVKKTNLAKVKTEQNATRFAVGEKIDAKVIKKLTKDNSYELSIKDHPKFKREKDALKEYGSSSSGASIGDIIGAALEEGKKKTSKSKDEKK